MITRWQKLPQLHRKEKKKKKERDFGSFGLHL